MIRILIFGSFLPSFGILHLLMCEGKAAVTCFYSVNMVGVKNTKHLVVCAVGKV